MSGGFNGSTFGENSLVCAVAMAALEIVQKKITNNAHRLGEIFSQEVGKLAKRFPIIKEVRDKDLLNTVITDVDPKNTTALKI